MGRLDTELNLAHCVIDDILDAAIASGKHKPNDWRELSRETLFAKAFKHSSIAYIPNPIDESEDHLANAACRLLMLLQLREEARLMTDATPWEPNK